MKVKKWRDQWLNILSWWNMITEKFSTRKHKDNNPLLLFFPNNTNISVGWFWFPVIPILMLQNPFLKVISDLHMILILSLRKRNSWTISAIIICWKLHPEAWQLKFQVVKIRLPSKHLKNTWCKILTWGVTFQTTCKFSALLIHITSQNFPKCCNPHFITQPLWKCVPLHLIQSHK